MDYAVSFLSSYVTAGSGDRRRKLALSRARIVLWGDCFMDYYNQEEVMRKFLRSCELSRPKGTGRSLCREKRGYWGLVSQMEEGVSKAPSTVARSPQRPF